LNHRLFPLSIKRHAGLWGKNECSQIDNFELSKNKRQKREQTSKLSYFVGKAIFWPGQNKKRLLKAHLSMGD
jgi:hypothetical protein